MKVTLEDGGKTLCIRMPANTVNPPQSATGKSLKVASSNGNKPTSVEVLGKNLVVGVNAYIPKG